MEPFKNFFMCVFIYFIHETLCAETNPYTILGLTKHATVKEIKRAYKHLAKEWHPDKSDHIDAEEKFIEIKQAYELLSDSERRHIYDQYGITNEDSDFFKLKHNNDHYARFAAVDDFFEKQFFFDNDVSTYHKLSISFKYFEQIVVPKSATIPQILLFYKNWCIPCTRIVNSFQNLIDIFEPLGINFATINAAHEKAIVRKTGAFETPQLILLINGHNYFYRESLYSPQKFVDFLRKKLPKNIVRIVDDDNYKDFLEGWMDNKIRALILEPRNQTRLRYLVTAFRFNERVLFGSVDLTKKNTQHLQNHFKVHSNLDTLLLFNEDTERPVASISMIDIPAATLKNVISSHQFLTLPRLSSQNIFEGVCPAEWSRHRKRLCIILITENSKAHDFARKALRHIALNSRYNLDRVRFAYIFKEKQSNFIRSISKGLYDDNLLRLVIIWRRDASHVKYEWFDSRSLFVKISTQELNDHIVNTTKEQIDVIIQRLLKTTEALSNEAVVQDLLDENAQGMFNKWFFKLLNAVDFLLDYAKKEYIYALSSLFGTIAFMFVVGYIMIYLVRAEEEKLKLNGYAPNDNFQRHNNNTPELKMYELRAEKYNGMVRLLKPGCRTIILITDHQSRTKLIPQFHKAVWPYRKTKTLIFGHMLIEKGLSWYAELLRLSLCETKRLEINPRNCVGTVLALNGHRKYFCMYHAKHPESVRGALRMVKMTTEFSKRSDDLEIGTLFKDYSEDSDDDPKVLFEEILLDGLSNWLDRLFEGSTHRYYVNYWPDFLIK